MKNVTVRFLRPVDGWQRGDEVTVALDPIMEKLIARGMVRIVRDERPKVPARNATADAWRSFLEGSGITVHPSMTRQRMIELWDDRGV